jgi:hypothetical protein
MELLGMRKSLLLEVLKSIKNKLAIMKSTYLVIVIKCEDVYYDVISSFNLSVMALRNLINTTTILTEA